MWQLKLPLKEMNDDSLRRFLRFLTERQSGITTQSECMFPRDWNFRSYSTFQNNCLGKYSRARVWLSPSGLRFRWQSHMNMVPTYSQLMERMVCLNALVPASGSEFHLPEKELFQPVSPGLFEYVIWAWIFWKLAAPTLRCRTCGQRSGRASPGISICCWKVWTRRREGEKSHLLGTN